MARIVTTTEQRDRNSAVVPGLGTDPAAVPGKANTRKYYLRQVRTYLGPTPAAHELNFFVERRCGDAFYLLLLPEHRQAVQAKTQAVESAMDEVGDAVDAAIDQAKDRIRGSVDEYVVSLSVPDLAEQRLRVRAARQQAQLAGDMVVSEGKGAQESHFRIRRDRFPDPFELRARDVELTAVRREILIDEVGKILRAEGLRALDPRLVQDTAARWQPPQEHRK